MDPLLLRFIISFPINVAVGVYAYTQQLIDDAAFLGGVALFTLTYIFLDWQAYAVVAAFFAISHFAIKQENSYRIKRGEFILARAKKPLKRVAARSLPGAIFAALFFSTGWDGFKIAFVASYAEAVCDSVSTKMGQIFSRRAVMINSLERVKHETAGAVSWQGTLAGAAAALILCLVGIPTCLISFAGFGIALTAALIGCFVDSFINAYSHRKKRIPNELINFSSGMAAGLISAVAAWCFAKTQ